MDEFRFDKVFSSIDHHGRYAYANQPPIAQWNLARLAECLLAVSNEMEKFEEALGTFSARYEGTWRKLMGTKLGFVDEQPGDDAMIDNWLGYLEENELDYTLSFRELAAQLEAGDESDRFGAFEKQWRRRIAASGREPGEVAAAMNRVNPLFIPRNHRIEQAIRGALDGDLQVFRELQTVLAEPYDEHRELAHYADAPEPDERVTRTFCGT
jgi:uncharacterized protein YdiU (UPF0061 family)